LSAALGSWRTVIPTTASSESTTIWRTAKLTAVRRSQTPVARRSKSAVLDGLAVVRPAAIVAMLAS
jgi:hypothetical protein